MGKRYLIEIKDTTVFINLNYLLYIIILCIKLLIKNGGNDHSFGHLQLVRGHEDDPLLVENVVDILQLLADRLTLLLILVSAETAETVRLSIKIPVVFLVKWMDMDTQCIPS
jgi:hypothetical protein